MRAKIRNVFTEWILRRSVFAILYLFILYSYHRSAILGYAYLHVPRLLKTVAFVPKAHFSEKYCLVEVTIYFWPKCQAKYEQLESTQEWTSSEILQLYKIVVQIRSRLRLSSTVPWFNWEKGLLKHFEPITKKTLNKDQSNLKNNTKPQPLWNVICYLKLSLKLLFYFLLQFRSTRHLTLI